MSLETPNVDKLTSKALYEKWNNGDGVSRYSINCFDSYQGLTFDQNIYNLCSKLIRNVNDSQDRENEEYYSFGRCKLLNYWLSDNVKKILGHTYENNYTQTINNLHEIWSKYRISKLLQSGGNFMMKIEEPRCKPDSNLSKLSNIEDKKRIHEHCLNYHELIKDSNNNRAECKSYEKYIKEKSSEYINFESLLTEEQNTHPIYYNECNSYNPENISSISKCSNAVPSFMRPAERTEEVHSFLGVEGARVQEVRGGVQVEEEEGRSGKGEEGGNGKGEEGGNGKEEEGGNEEKEGSLPPSPLQSFSISQSSDGDSIIHLQQRTSEQSAGDVTVHSVTQTEDQRSSTGTIISTSSVGFVGFLFLLYKFTPLRTVFDPRIRKTKNMLKDGVQGNNELQSQDYDFFPPVVDTNKYNIAYQSR